MKPRVGQMLASTVDATTVIVIRWPEGDHEITCGGAPMVDSRAPEAGSGGAADPDRMVDSRAPEAGSGGAADPDRMGGSQLGKRYAEDLLGVELLCTKAGQGTLAVNGTPLPLKVAKPLPASD